MIYITTGPDKKIVKDTYELINDSLECNFTLEALAENTNLSKYHFLRLFKKEFGITPHHFIINQRVNKAQELIKKGMILTGHPFFSSIFSPYHFPQ